MPELVTLHPLTHSTCTNGDLFDGTVVIIFEILKLVILENYLLDPRKGIHSWPDTKHFSDDSVMEIIVSIDALPLHVT